MAKINVVTIKSIASLGSRELRYTDINGEKKYDIRVWNGDNYEPGVRFTQDELIQIKKYFDDNVSSMVPIRIGNKEAFRGDEEWCLSIISNGREYIRPFATDEEIDKLLNIMEASNNDPLSYEEPVVEQPKKKRGRPKKSTAIDEAIDEIAKQKSLQKKIAELTAKTSNEKPKEKPKKNYKNAYEKFADQFKEYRESQPENRRRGFELTHEVITNHIKDIIKTSDEYNQNAMQDWKNSANMMNFVQNKAFENADAYMNIQNRAEAEEFLCQWVDEYIGDTSDKPKPKTKKSKQKV